MKMRYKNCIGEFEFDKDTNTYEGIVIGIRDIIHFSAKNKEDIEQAFHESVEDYIEFCKESGKRPEKSYSGKIPLRIDPKMHANLAVEAEYKGMSLNAFIISSLQEKKNGSKANK